jgi:hypothetical protein
LGRASVGAWTELENNISLRYFHYYAVFISVVLFMFIIYILFITTMLNMWFIIMLLINFNSVEHGYMLNNEL